MGYADAGFNGGTQIQTPYLNALAREGTVLRSFYVQPVCSPTRATLMTGRYVAHDAILISATTFGKAALRMGNWKLVNAAKDELYNLADDIGETTDLAAANPSKLLEMQAKLATLLKDAVPFGGEGLGPKPGKKGDKMSSESD